jgi:hypothetical protein
LNQALAAREAACVGDGVSLAFARRHSDTIEEVSDVASVSRYGESAGKSRISRRWASANAWYGIVGKM